jgi:hypothetical protein
MDVPKTLVVLSADEVGIYKKDYRQIFIINNDSDDCARNNWPKASIGPIFWRDYFFSAVRQALKAYLFLHWKTQRYNDIILYHVKKRFYKLIR